MCRRDLVNGGWLLEVDMLIQYSLSASPIFFLTWQGRSFTRSRYFPYVFTCKKSSIWSLHVKLILSKGWTILDLQSAVKCILPATLNQHAPPLHIKHAMDTFSRLFNSVKIASKKLGFLPQPHVSDSRASVFAPNAITELRMQRGGFHPRRASHRWVKRLGGRIYYPYQKPQRRQI